MDARRHSPFGDTLRRLREAAALSQEELAERAGLSVRGISDLERGVRTMPRLETVRMLADGLGLDGSGRAALLAARNHPSEPPRVVPPPGLPIPPTSFVGRRNEIDQAVAMLNSNAVRLLTLIGPGGVGKTRVAIEVAGRIAPSFPGNIVFVDLSAIRNPHLVIPAIADSLGVAAHADQEIRDVLTAALPGRSILLVLDNFEQVADAAVDIAWLLSVCPTIKAIVTSRIVLRIGAEHVMPIEPLAVPTSNDLDILHQLDAVTLFVARAHAADHAFTLNDDTAPVVADVVTRLQGMPLAIELAAARMRALSLPDLLQRFDTQLSVLVGGARDLPDRHRTMRDTIAWSYGLLSPIEQKVFRFLAIFPDGCLLETLIKVLNAGYGLDEVTSVDAVGSLVDSSMVQRHEGGHDHVRYRMLQPVREFGLEQLIVAQEESLARKAAHTSWFVPLAHKVEYAIDLPDAVFHLNRTEAEHQNLREHLAWLKSNGLMEEALDLSAALAFFRGIRGYFDESRLELEGLLNHPQNLDPSDIRMRGLIGLGIVLNQRAAGARSLPYLKEAAEMARDLNAPWYLSLALLSMGLSHFRQHQIDDAEKCFQEGQKVATAIDATFLTAANMHFVGQVAGLRGDVSLMKKLLHEGLILCEREGLVWGVAVSKINLASLYLEEDDLDRAEVLAREAQNLFFDIENNREGSGVYLMLADIALRRGDLESAEEILRRRLAYALKTGYMPDIAYSYKVLARIAHLSGDLQSADEHIRKAIDWYERGGSGVEAVRCLENLAELFLALGDAERASWCLGAVDGVLACHGIVRTGKGADEYLALMTRVKAQPDEDGWRECYERATTLSAADILQEYRSWAT